MRFRGKRRFFNKPTISQENYDLVKEESEAAKELLESERFKFFREYFENAQSSIRDMILENRVNEVREILSVSKKLKRMFITPKKVQVDELVGQYKFIKTFLDDLLTTANMKSELDDAIQSREAVLEDDDTE